MDGTSIAAVLLEHAEFVRRLATQLAGADEGQDVAQDAWAKVLARPAQRVHDPVGWLRAVVINTWRNRHRGERRHRTHAAAAAPGAAGVVPSAEQIAVREEVRRNVVAAVLALPEPLRDVVVLHFHEGLASPEVAARLGLSPSGVRTRMQQAIDRLRQRLDGEYGGTRAAWAVPLLQWRRHAPGAPVAAAFVIATWLRIAAVLLVAATAALWLAAGDADPPAHAGPVRSGSTAAAIEAHERGEPPTAASQRVEIAAAAAPPPRAYRGESPTGSLRGRVTDALDGRLLADVVVRVRAVEPASSTIAPLVLGVREQRELRSDAGGEFVLADLPAAPYEVEAATADGRRALRRVAVAGGEARVELRLHPQPFAGSATVKVLDVTRRPVAGAGVTLVLHCTRRGAIGFGGVPAIHGTTDALGTFRLQDQERLETVFEGLASASTADGRAGITVIGRPEHRGDRAYWEVIVDRPGEVVATLAGAAGDELAAARVFAEPIATYRHVWPDGPRHALERTPEGTFRAAVPAGRYHLRVALPGKRRLLEEPVGSWQFLPVVTVEPGQRTATTIALGAAAIVRGRVADAQDTPIAGADVHALRAPQGVALFVHTPHGADPEDVYGAVTARCDANGRYELQLSPGRWHVVAIAAGLTMDVHADVEVGERPVDIEHRLRPDGAVQGSTSMSWLALRAADTPALVHAIYTMHGVFALRGLAPGRWQVGRVDGTAFVALTAFEVAAGRVTFLEVDRAPTHTVRGAVVRDGVGVPDLDVVWADSGARASTAADGSFEVHVPNGTSELRVEHRGVLLQRVQCTPAAERHDLGVVALQAERVSVRAVGPDDRPEPATLWAEHPFDHTTVTRRFSADGRLAGQWLPVSEHTQPIVGARFADGSEQSVVVRPGEAEIVLRRAASGSLELRVVDSEGCPRPAAAFQVLPWGRTGEAPRDGAAFAAARDAKARGGYALTDARGRAIVHGVMPGPALVYFTGDWSVFGYGRGHDRGAPPLEQVVEIRNGQTLTVDLVLPRY